MIFSHTRGTAPQTVGWTCASAPAISPMSATDVTSRPKQVQAQ